MSEKTEIYDYDVANHLRTPTEMADYLEACIEESDGDPTFMAKAIGDAARAYSMANLARDTGV